MLKIEELSYRYQSRENFTLQKINLQLARGEMLLLAGRSGCGKSTLIKAISGLLNNNDKGELRGKIYLENEDITNFSPEKILSSGKGTFFSISPALMMVSNPSFR